MKTNGAGSKKLSRNLVFFSVLWVALLISVWARAEQATLVWGANTESDLDGYKVRSGTARGSYTTSVDVHKVTISRGAYLALTDKLALVGTVNWQNWSRFGEPEISVADSNTGTADLKYQDTYHPGLGVYCRVADHWLLMVGFGYDTSPTSSSSDRSPVLPLGATFRYAAGVQYDWNKDLSVGAAYTLIEAGTAKVNRTGELLKGDIEGEYDNNFMHALNVTFVYRF